MFFKSATFFQLKESIDFEVLENAISNFPLKECGSQEAFSFGSVPLMRDSEVWSITGGSCILMRFAKEEKALPPYVIREELEKKVSEIEAVEGRKVGRKEKTDIKEELIYTLRPKAFSKVSDVWLHIDNKAGILVIYSTSASIIEQAFKHMQTMLGSFPITPLQAQASPTLVITDWLAKNELPGSLETGDRCDIQDSSEDKAKIKFTNLEPLSDDVTRHLDQGMTVRSLSVSWSGKMSFILKDDLSLSSVKFDDVLKENAFNDSDGGGKGDLDATFAITSLTTRELFGALCGWFEIEVGEK